METRFVWKCSYMGSAWYDVIDETGHYEAEFRHKAGDYELSIANGDDCRRDILASVGIFRRAHLSDSDLFAWKHDKAAPCYGVPQSTVDAFNTWRIAERRKAYEQMKAAPERYGDISETDPLVFPAFVTARRGWYVSGFGWQSEEESVKCAA